MNLYETVFISRQDLSTADAEALGEKFADTIKELGGKVAKKEYWGLRSLAYKINKSKKGHYTLINFEGTPDSIKELERRFRLNEDVVRSIVLRVEAFSKEPSVILRDDSDDKYAA